MGQLGWEEIALPQPARPQQLCRQLYRPHWLRRILRSTQPTHARARHQP